jgi:putative ABC transport system permease protein
VPEGGYTSSAIQLDAIDLSVAAGLILLAGAVSLGFGLRMEKRLGIASLRTVVQLLLVGFVLREVFAMDTLPAVLLVVVLMVAAASREAVRRPSRRMPGAARLAFVTLLASCFLTTVTVTSAVVRVDPWFRPQYLIPLMGMALGNGLTGISLCLDQLLETLDERRAQVELELSLGATRWEAAAGPLRDAVRRGLIPIINAMTAAGIVALPGMMTGQILAGADPVEAVKYQVVVMFLISGATALGCMLIALLVYRRLFNERHQLRADLIAPRDA